MKKIFFAIVVLITTHSFSQELIKSTAFSVTKKSDVFQIVEESKKQVSLFFSDKKNVRSIRFDNNFNILDSITVERPSNNYDDIVGYSLSENQYSVYWSNSNGKEIVAQCFDYKAKKVNSKSFSLTFEKEKLIKKITVNNVFYMITILKNTSVLNFYVFKDGTLDKKSVDLSSKKFLAKNNTFANLWDIVSVSTNFEMPNTFQTISNESPPSLVFSANKRKLYAFENKLSFVLDQNRKFTQTFTIDLNDFSYLVKMFNKPSYPEDLAVLNEDGQLDPAYYDSNSFLLKDKLVQIKNNSNYITISVKDLEGIELKSFIINNTDISIKNSDIYQENGGVKSLRVLDKSSQLLRKISDLNPSLSIYSGNDKLYMILGGVSLMEQNSALMYGGMFGAAGVLIGAAISSNYSMNNLNSYKGRKVVYVNCLFDNDFNHIDGVVKKTAFDELRAFAETNDNLIAPVLFKFNSSLYYGGFDKDAKTYLFYKFND
jgi:hypothetical protein